MARRTYTRQFKLAVVQMVNAQGHSPCHVAKDLGVDPARVREWGKTFSAENGLAPTGEGLAQAELRRLRKENAQLRMEQEI